ncbi:MAG: hypothetical protein ACTS41_01875 [Candidatus Hodgkinia cicadicola]
MEKVWSFWTCLIAWSLHPPEQSLANDSSSKVNLTLRGRNFANFACTFGC